MQLKDKTFPKAVKRETKTCEYSLFCIDFNRAKLKCNLRCCAKSLFVVRWCIVRGEGTIIAAKYALDAFFLPIMSRYSSSLLTLTTFYN